MKTSKISIIMQIKKIIWKSLHVRVEVVEAQSAAGHANVGVERIHNMPPEFAARAAHVADHANQTSSWYQDPENLGPDLVQLGQKCFVVGNVTKLAGGFVVSLEIPVRRRCNNEMNGFIRQKGNIPRVSVDESVRRGFHGFPHERKDGRQEPGQNAPQTGLRPEL